MKIVRTIAKEEVEESFKEMQDTIAEIRRLLIS